MKYFLYLLPGCCVLSLDRGFSAGDGALSMMGSQEPLAFCQFFDVLGFPRFLSMTQTFLFLKH